MRQQVNIPPTDRPFHEVYRVKSMFEVYFEDGHVVCVIDARDGAAAMNAARACYQQSSPREAREFVRETTFDLVICSPGELRR